MLSQDQRQEFERWGVLRIPGAVPVAEAAQMCDRVWEFLGREHAAVRDQPETWPQERVRGFQRLSRSGAFEAMGAESIRLVVTELLGAHRWDAAGLWGARPLVTFPRPDGSWTLPTGGWHIDGGSGPAPGITTFCYLDAVEPENGGTMVLAGSNRLITRMMMSADAQDGQPPSSHVIKARLGSANPWLRDLWTKGSGHNRVQRYMKEGTIVDGVPLKAVELTGAPGDVVFMSTHTMHVATPNVSRRPRMMLLRIFI